MIELTLPFPPAVNNITAVVRGRKITSKRGREYRAAAVEMIQGQYRGSQIDGRLQVQITLVAPTRQKRDIDNYSKAVLDAITAAGVWDDDEQVDRIEIIRGEIRKPGAAVVTIQEVAA
ncbi:RusA family crossover junction endodeoxyribonuclease [Phytohalomonas tamaricis]|uniref:RusA family crossover junction endodeoxyribonuclease n=1 Tax=Phytohalomonas tamaricis TaxID=2081032 RepID=UPI000D0AD2BD|nr:RusA family crossover junction endodeoxyribonuclease [Phytohalomonas tamaricis]